MPAPFVVRKVRPNNGILQVHLSLDLGQPNEIWINATREVMAMICGDVAMREGDLRNVQMPFESRPGRNGHGRK